MKKLFLTFLLSCFLTFPAWATTYYIRADGGTTTQCTGTTNAAYDGSGTGEACALAHPAWALGAYGTSGIMVGGDTLQSADTEEYMIGYGMPNTVGCSAASSRNCTMNSPPAGIDSDHKTKIYGYNYSNCSGKKTQWWGTERVYGVLYILEDNIDVRCLDITDHSACIYSGPADGMQGAYPVKCNSTSSPYGTYADRGIFASLADGIELHNVDVHGLAHTTIAGLNLGTWDIYDSKFIAGGFVGWDSDYNVDDSYTGTITFDGVNLEWSGCGEVYPLNDASMYTAATTGQATPLPSTNIHHCWSQDQGGYGDGIGLGDGNPGNWVFLKSSISHNTSDGLDLLHGSGTNTVTIKNSVMEGNAGNQLKMSGVSQYVENSKIIGNCAFFYGQSFTSTKDVNGGTTSFNNCRAGGNSIETVLNDHKSFILNGSTVYGNGDVLVDLSGSYCDGTTTLQVRNSILLGGIEFNDGSDYAAYYYNGSGSSGCNTQEMDIQYSQISNVHNSVQPSGTGNIYTEPEFTDSPISSNYQGINLDVTLTAGSDAKDAADESVSMTAVDYNGWARGESWDMGAYEYDTQGGGSSCDATCIGCYTEVTCEAQSCNWWTTNTCNVDAETCTDTASLCLTEGDCETAGFYWWSTDTCNTYAEPCSTTCEGCLSQSACEEVISGDSSCIGGWSLNENASDGLVEDSCGDINGSLKANGSTINTSTVAATGKLNGAFTFNGSTNTRSVEMGDSFKKETTDAFSLEAWIKSNDVSAEQQIVGKIDEDSLQTGYIMNIGNIGAGNKLNFMMIASYPTDYWFVLGDTTLQNSTWYHVVMTYDGSNTRAGVTLYINGVAETPSYSGSSALSGSTYSRNNPFAIGCRVGSAGTRNTSFNGLIDNVRIYNKELSSAEVLQLYNSGAGLETIFDSTQACYWSGSACSTGVPSACDSSCGSCETEISCEASAAGCYWYNNTCNETPEAVPSKQMFGCSLFNGTF